MRLPGVRHLSSNLEPFFAEGNSLGGRAQLGMAHGKMGTGMDGGQDSLTKVLAAPRSVEGGHRLREYGRSPDDSRPGPGKRYTEMAVQAIAEFFSHADALTRQPAIRLSLAGEERFQYSVCCFHQQSAKA